MVDGKVDKAKLAVEINQLLGTALNFSRFSAPDVKELHRILMDPKYMMQRYVNAEIDAQVGEKKEIVLGLLGEAAQEFLKNRPIFQFKRQGPP